MAMLPDVQRIWLVFLLVLLILLTLCPSQTCAHPHAHPASDTDITTNVTFMTGRLNFTDALSHGFLASEAVEEKEKCKCDPGECCIKYGDHDTCCHSDQDCCPGIIFFPPSIVHVSLPT